MATTFEAWDEKGVGVDRVPNINEYIDDLIGPGGRLERECKGFKARAGQVGMARSVDESFRRSGIVFAEGPTGTGKSLAYALPAAYHAVRIGAPAVIVTANIALQEQLVKKDLPLLRAYSTWPFTFGLLKGKNNYVCIRQLKKTSKRLSSKGLSGARTEKRRSLPVLTAEENEQLGEIFEWEQRSSTGDKSELDFEPRARVWSKVAVSHEDCIGKDCGEWNSCYSVRARRDVSSVDVLVTNYWMLYLNVRLGGFILPRYNFLVMDEAHKAVEIARDFFGNEVSRGAVQSLLDPLVSDRNLSHVMPVTNALFQQLAALRKSGPHRRRLQSKLPANYQPVVDGLRLAASTYVKRKELIDVEHKMLGAGTDPDIVARANKRKAESAEYENKSVKALALAKSLEDMAELADPNSVVFIESRGDNRPPVLRSKPVEVGDMLYSSLLSGHGVAITSATLSDGNSFGYIADQFGIRDPKCYVAPSPFDLSRQAYLIVDETMPMPTEREAFRRGVCERLVKIIRMTRGRVLGLFTSYDVLNYAYDYARKHLPDFVIYRQGDMPRIKLIGAFQQNTWSCLFGTESFWAGVDVPGDSLSCVVMDRLPFQNPDDPVLDYLTEEYEDWFFRFSLPKAVIQFRQGFGRLIRSTTDRGVVVVLDPRILRKSYGSRFLASLPRVHMGKDLEEIKKILPNGVYL